MGAGYQSACQTHLLMLVAPHLGKWELYHRVESSRIVRAVDGKNARVSAGPSVPVSYGVGNLH